MQTFAEINPGDQFTLNAGHHQPDWVTATAYARDSDNRILFTFDHPAKNGQDSAVFTQLDYIWHVANRQILPLETDAEEVITTQRATIDAAKSALDRTATRIAELEAENEVLRERIAVLEARKEADADAETIRRLRRYLPA